MNTAGVILVLLVSAACGLCWLRGYNQGRREGMAELRDGLNRMAEVNGGKLDFYSSDESLLAEALRPKSTKHTTERP